MPLCYVYSIPLIICANEGEICTNNQRTPIIQALHVVGNVGIQKYMHSIHLWGLEKKCSKHKMLVSFYLQMLFQAFFASFACMWDTRRNTCRSSIKEVVKIVIYIEGNLKIFLQLIIIFFCIRFDEHLSGVHVISCL